MRQREAGLVRPGGDQVRYRWWPLLDLVLVAMLIGALVFRDATSERERTSPVDQSRALVCMRDELSRHQLAHPRDLTSCLIDAVRL